MANFLIELTALEDKNFNEARSLPLQTQYFRVVQRANSLKFDIDPMPIDYEATINSYAYQDYILLRKAKIERWNWSYKRIFNSTLETIAAIEKYLSEHQD